MFTNLIMCIVGLPVQLYLFIPVEYRSCTYFASSFYAHVLGTLHVDCGPSSCRTVMGQHVFKVPKIEIFAL
jgi:hypothetical protein